MRSPPSSSYRTFLFNLTLTERAFVVCANGDLLAVPTAARAIIRPHSTRPSAVTTPSSSTPVVGARVLERLDATEELADIAEQDAARLAVVPARRRRRRSWRGRASPQVLRARPDVGDAAEAVLQPAVAGVPDHRGVEARARHDGEALAVEAADVEPAVGPCRPDRRRPADVLRDAEVGREQVRGAGGHDREARIGAREHVDAALHHPVAAPHEDELRAFVPAPADLLGRIRLFGTSHQNGPSTPSASRTRRSSGSPPPSVLPAWAMTATFMRRLRPRRRGGARNAARERRAPTIARCRRAIRRRRRAGGASRGTCAKRRRSDHDRDRRGAQASARSAVRDPRDAGAAEPAVDRDRRRRVAGRIARVRPAGARGGRHAAGASGRAGVVDAVGRRLDGQHERRRRPASPPFAEDRAARARRADEDREHERRRRSSRPATRPFETACAAPRARRRRARRSPDAPGVLEHDASRGARARSRATAISAKPASIATTKTTTGCCPPSGSRRAARRGRRHAAESTPPMPAPPSARTRDRGREASPAGVPAAVSTVDDGGRFPVLRFANLPNDRMPLVLLYRRSL